MQNECVRCFFFLLMMLMPVAHAALPGFRGPFRNGCSAETGERVWRTVPKMDELTDMPENGSGRGADRYRLPPGGSGFGSMIYVDGRFPVLGENGLLVWMELSPEGYTIGSCRRLFTAEQTRVVPVVPDGYVYSCQNLPDPESGGERLICMNLKGEYHE